MTDRVDLKLGFDCNNRCHFCVQGDKRSLHSPRSWDRIRHDLFFGYLRGARGLVVTGGEPTIQKRFMDVIRLARHIGYQRIQVQTNGRRFHYRPFCEAVVAAGANEFSPALHGATAPVHDELTQAPGSYQQVVRGIENLVALGQPVITNTVITSLNYQELPALARLLVELGVEQFQLAFVHIVGTAAKNEQWLVARKSDVLPYVKEALDIGAAGGVRCMTEAIPFCLMSGYESFVAEAIIPNTLVFDADKTIHDYTVYRLDQGKARREECSTCLHFEACEGPWREYPVLHGWDEFVPVVA